MTPPAPRRAGDEAAERIISLLWLLLSAPHGLERDRIRRQVVGYEGLTDAAFEKLFQRDRRVLRAVGVPLETLEADSFEEEAQGVRHRVVRDAMLLRDLDLTVDERRALVRARRLWGDSPLRADVVRAVGLLFAPTPDLAADDELAGYHALTPRADPRLEALTQAVAEEAVLRFPYRDARGRESRRTVRAWFLTLVRGRWYLTGWDADREAERSFRLTRMEGEPRRVERAASLPGRPADHDHADLVARLAGQADAERVRVWLAPGRGQGVRAVGERVDPRAEDGAAPGDGWELWEAPAGTHEDGLAAEVGGLLGRAVPSAAAPDLARRVADALAAAARAHAGPAAPALLEVPLAPPVRRRARDSSEDLVGRLLDIVGLANRADGVDRAELRARLGVTEERLDADLETLRYCGMPERDFPGFQFEVDEEGGRVHVRRAADLAGPVRLTRPEGHSLVAALQTVADLPVLDDADRAAARSAQRRIAEAVLDAGGAAASAADDEALAEAEAGTAPTPAPGGAVAAHWDVAVDPETVRTLLAAIAERRVLRLDYRSVHADALSERDVEPLAVVQDGARLYLRAWCRSAGEDRVFRVDRIGAAAATGEAFAPRARPARWRVHPDEAAGTPAVLRWAHRVRDAAAGYRPEAQADLPDGDRLTRVRLTDADVAAALVGRHGGAVEVLYPAAMRAHVKDALDRAVDALAAR